MSATRKAQADLYLNDVEKAQLAAFADNPTMFEAVKKVILAPALYDGRMFPGEDFDPSYNHTLNLVSKGDRSDEEIAKKLRAQWEAINYIGHAFAEVLSLYASPKSGKKAIHNRGL
ncbi:hypothetical protein [Dongia sp.]|uniref:hypothetical protein n=1 Tax=Dongia sp. TaxID=1977262 RepID=UPI003753D9D4